jgi:5-methylcytosine-specific restriction endonuclease McrA
VSTKEYNAKYYQEHIDHIEPVSKTGSGDWDNLTAACASCNTSKNATSLLTFLSRRGEII